LLKVLAKYYKTCDEGLKFFAYETMVWQCSTKGHEDLFQGYFSDDNTYSWSDL